jgi:hypothetical protein
MTKMPPAGYPAFLQYLQSGRVRNAEILKRIVRAIAVGSQDDLERLAHKVVESERKSGHTKLAEELDGILKRPKPKNNGHAPATDSERGLKELPLSTSFQEKMY